MVKLLEIRTDFEATFIARPNRYLAKVDIDGSIELAHVHDPGRLQELLYTGNKVLLRKASNTNRKTAYDVIAAKLGDEWILINSAFHRKISEAILGNSEINPIKDLLEYKAEVKYGKSRFDFYIQSKKGTIWLETKGCTLSENKVAIFPDAPTTRGLRHIQELTEIAKAGKEKAAVLILVLTDSNTFRPNSITDPKFTEAFYEAMELGVRIYPVLLEYKEEYIHYKGIIDIEKR